MEIVEIRTKATEALAAVPVGIPLGTELFKAIARLSISVPIEAVALRMQDGRLCVHMTQRPANAPTYQEQWHCIGSFQRPGESEFDTLQRLATGEVKTPIVQAVLIGRFDNPQEEVGQTKHLIFLVEFASEPSLGVWFPVDQLPENTVKHHRETVIPAAVAAYSGDRSTLERLLPTKIV